MSSQVGIQSDVGIWRGDGGIVVVVVVVGCWCTHNSYRGLCHIAPIPLFMRVFSPSHLMIMGNMFGMSGHESEASNKQMSAYIRGIT